MQFKAPTIVTNVAVFSGSNEHVRGGRFVLEHSQDGETWDGFMTAGFTAGTGKRAAGHTINSWTFH